MSFEEIYTMLGEEKWLYLFNPDRGGAVGTILEDWLENVVDHSFPDEMTDEEEDAICDRFREIEEAAEQKIVVSYITGKTRIIQKWVRSSKCRARIGRFLIKVKRN